MNLNVYNHSKEVQIKNDKITPCCISFNKDLILGSLKSTTIYKAWNSEKMNNLRKCIKKVNFI